MYRPVTSLVNGEIIKDLLDICNESFINPLIKPYAGANSECMFCGATENRDETIDHSAADCPVIKYQDLINKHKRFIIVK
jgi:hypothetical protein